MSPEEARRQVAEGKTIVVHMKRDAEIVRWAKEENLYVRIDRRSRWGNPYQIGRHGSREDVCQLFREKRLPYLLTEIDSLRGKVLGCWCAPQQCHGDDLARAANSKD